ncbi:MAG: hypothetical protein JWN31_844 [Frankiales bacterium]|nr:hypothetical protein [Frankiales bacterium]
MRRPILPLVAVLLLASACGRGDPGSATATPSPAQTTAAAGCPAATGSFAWPADVPRDLPQPAGATYKLTVRRGGLTSVRYSSPTSLRESLLLVLRQLPKRGFTIGRGDAEPAEADVPFGRGDVIGIYKMIIVGPCSTDWLVAVGHKTQIGGSPILPTIKPGPSSSPLPFG